MTSLYHSLVETNIKNVHSHVCQVSIKLFKICGDFVEVHDDNDDDPEKTDTERKGRSTRCDKLKPKPKPGRGWAKGSDSGWPHE